jgi:hypothetical protein
MQKHIGREIEAAANAQSATDAVAAAIQFVRAVADEHAAHRPKAGLKLPFGAEQKAAVVDDAIVSVAENSAAEYVRQIARGKGPAERQQFSLGNQLTWSAGRALPQFLFQGKPLLLTDPDQVARWDRLAQQEGEEHASGRITQLFKVQSKPAPRAISLELEKTAEGKITFQSADRPGWDKVIYYRAGEKGAAERLAEILRNNRELSDQQQAEVWRLEGWPEPDIARELERVRHVQQMHDESWWTPPPSFMDRARRHAKTLLSFRRGKDIAPAKTKPERAQPLLGEIQRSPQPTVRLPKSAPFDVGEIQRRPEQVARLPKSAPFNVGEIQRPPEQVARSPKSAPFKVDEGAEAEPMGNDGYMSLPKSTLVPAAAGGFDQVTDLQPAAPSGFERAPANRDTRISSGVSRKDERLFQWLEAAMADVHRHAQRHRRSPK